MTHYSLQCVLFCNRIRSLLINNAFTRCKSANLYEINLAVDVINYFQLKKNNVKKHQILTLSSTYDDLPKDIKNKSYAVDIENIHKYVPKNSIVLSLFGINHPYMNEIKLTKLLSNVSSYNYCFIGAFYDKACIEKLLDSKEVYEKNFFKIQKNNDGTYELYFTYNLMTGCKINNTIIAYDQNYLKQLASKYNLKVYFNNYEEYSSYFNVRDLHGDLLESLYIRKCFTFQRSNTF